MTNAPLHSIPVFEVDGSLYAVDVERLRRSLLDSFHVPIQTSQQDAGPSPLAHAWRALDTWEAMNAARLRQFGVLTGPTIDAINREGPAEMTEQEWLTLKEPAAMVRWLRACAVTDGSRPCAIARKLRLWVEACRAIGDLRGIFDLDAVVGLREAIEDWSEPAEAPTLRMDTRADLLRHIVGNPFRPVALPTEACGRCDKGWITTALRDEDGEASRTTKERCDCKDGVRLTWPIVVVQVAEAVYAGQEAAFALRDALLDAGHPDLADHFVGDETHPKGCWALDLIMGRE